MSAIANVRRAGGQKGVTIRPGTLEDAERCGRICFEAFTAVATAHGYPSDVPTLETGIGLVTMLFAHPGFSSMVAERDGRIVGSAFLDERSRVASLWPVTVDPAAREDGLRRLLVQDALERAFAKGCEGIRLTQAAYDVESLELYAGLGFEAGDVVACMQGPSIGAEIIGCSVRTATEADREACNRVCREVHGYERDGEVRDAIAEGSALIVERGDRVTGYATSTGFLGHAVGMTTDDVKALLGAARRFDGPGILVPARNGELFRWGLEQGLRVVSLMVLMGMGVYREPVGAYVPSVHG